MLAARGGLQQLPGAFQQLDPMAALDPELDQVLRERNEGRRNALRAIVSRLPASGAPLAETIDLLFALISFENFAVLAGPDRTPEEVAPLVKRAARTIAAPRPRKTRKPN